MQSTGGREFGGGEWVAPSAVAQLPEYPALSFLPSREADVGRGFGKKMVGWARNWRGDVVFQKGGLLVAVAVLRSCGKGKEGPRRAVVRQMMEPGGYLQGKGVRRSAEWASAQEAECRQECPQPTPAQRRGEAELRCASAPALPAPSSRTMDYLPVMALHVCPKWKAAINWSA